MHQTTSNVEELFFAALELESSEARSAYLDRVCGNTELRRRVERLLALDPEADDYLEAPASIPTVTIAPDARSGVEGPGITIGPYKLLEQIGEGGMGLVYMAEQQRPLRRMVALKIIKPGMDSRQVLARFEAEKQALAMMDHENIAKVFDAGTTEAGHPFFVMELVRGIPIHDFCDQKRLTVRERLELFVQVCEAVQHAHQKGIIHRDLKPTNVLVTMHDVRAVPKVIDFGIAKALGPSLTEHSLYTGFAQLVGTPLYMSPEQAEMNQLGVDTRSDVYSLGVLLYELLTGTTPFDKEALGGSGLEEMRRMIREDEPVPPSARVSSLQPEALSTTSRRRSTDPRRITAALHGELDWIVMKALEKDRGRRYESASAFATDIQRYLDDEPVLACPASTMYKFHKFARKHRAALATAVAIAASLILGTTASAWQAVRATTAEAQANANATQAREKAQEATTQRNEAQKQRDEVRALNDRLQRTLYAAHMNVAQHTWEDGNIQRVQELLEEHRPKAGESDLRGFEWYYLDRLCHAEILSIKDMGGEVFSPDRTRLASTINRGDGTGPQVKVWDAQTGRELLTIEHGGGVVAFSPDGKRLATGARSAQGLGVKMWDAQTGQELTTFKGHTGPVFGVVFSPDSTRLASTINRGPGTSPQVKVWDAQTGQEILSINGQGRLVFSPDGKRLVSMSGSGSGPGWGAPGPGPGGGGPGFGPGGGGPGFGPRPPGVNVWDAQTGQEIFSIKGEGRWVLSPDGKRLASPAADKTVKLWDARTGQEILSLKGHTNQVDSVAFSPDGTRLASTINGGNGITAEVKVWDAQTGQELFTLEDTSGSVTFSPDGKRLASSSLPHGEDRTVKVWDAQTGEELLSCKGHNGQINSFAFSPDGKRLASGGWDRMVHVWDAQTGQELLKYKGHSGMINSVTFSPDGTRLASRAMDGTVKVWDATTSPEARRIGGYTGVVWSMIWSVVFSPDGKRLAGASWDDMADDDNNTVKVWDAQTGRELCSVKGSTDDFLPAFSPDGKRLACAATDHTVKVWDAQTGQELFILKGHTDRDLGVAFSPNGKRLAGSATDHTVKVWDAQTGQELFILKGHTDPVFSMAFSPDGKRLTSASLDNTVKVWDAQAGQELFSFTTGRSRGAAFSPDGKRLATASGRWQVMPKDREAVPGDVKVWDTQTGQELLTIKGAGGMPVFSPDGKRLASAIGGPGPGRGRGPTPGIPAEVKVWDAQTGQELFTLKGHIAAIRNIVFSPDGKRIVTGCGDRTAKVWDAEKGQELFNLKAVGEIYSLAFSPDGHRLVGDSSGRVTIWDATPLTEK